MNAAFAGPTAAHYLRYRRDVPAAVLDRLVGQAGLDGDSLALDLGAGTGQVAVPLAARLGTVLAADPEPDMLALLRHRGEEEGLRNLLCVLAADLDVPTLLAALGPRRVGLVTVANALHWMDAPALFGAAHRGLAPGGALAVVTHGVPLWLADTAWSRAVHDHLTGWFGQRVSASCGSDEAALRERRDQLTAAGFSDVAVWEHRYRSELDIDYVIGHLYSALSEDVLPAARRAEFEAGLRLALRPFQREPMIEDVPVTVLLGRR